MQAGSEADRRAALVAAEARANALFDAIERRGLIAPGRSEREVEQDIYALAETQFGVARHWHKRIVRSGPNTLKIAADNPPVRSIASDDIVYLDLGPVFEEWEADVGRSYVLGDDPVKHALVADLPRMFDRVQAHFHATPGITGGALYAFAQRASRDAGWVFGGQIVGHIVSEFAHAQIPGGRALYRADAAHAIDMRALDGNGREQHWILEIHLLNPEQTFGGFYERLM